ncbi:MAG: M1 family metallopeptidase [Ferruginibacter sp.]
MKKKVSSLLFLITLIFCCTAQDIKNNPGSNHGNRFEQLGTILPTPNEYRTASGAPGPKYWQQRCDYDIVCELDEPNRKLNGKETVTYFNNSPDPLSYLWIQLDENEHSSKNNAGYQNSTVMPKSISVNDLGKYDEKTDREYGDNITKLTDATGKPIPFTINKTMMRIDLPSVLKPGQQYIFKVEWNYYITDRLKAGGRGGYEFFPEDGNDLYTMTQWYPRLCVYSDFQGWQNHQFAGSGEFALTFGNFKVAITVPADHIILATGEAQNYQQVLSPAQFSRWQKAQTAKEVIEIATLQEARDREKQKSSNKKTWIFKAEMVRDFAWGSSRKFIWDAMPTIVEGKKVMCMSGYGKEAYNLYWKFSTKAVAHTIKTYSQFTIPYPYPVAQSIEAANGMEYPMICFNYGRCEKDGTYSEATKVGMLGVIIHEVGHNFFPMIINSDERQWTWMDEGLNSFYDYLTKELWDNKFPVSRGPAYKIVDYMSLPKDQLEPIMTNSENIIQFGPNAYSKPSTALNILRETIIGRELFDFALKQYSRRWAFKHPTPADLFRTMEDATGEDLDWFWRGWFYGTDACDISLDSVKWATLSTEYVTAAPPVRSRRAAVGLGPMLNSFDDISKIRNREDKSIKFATDADTSLRDFYWSYDRGLVQIDSTLNERTAPVATPDPFTDQEKLALAGSKNLYELTFTNRGGLIMPIIIEFTYKDGSKEIERIPAQIWRKNETQVVKTFMKDKEVASIKIDPLRETADINENNNSWPTFTAPSKFQLFKNRSVIGRGGATGTVNPMQRKINN